MILPSTKLEFSRIKTATKDDILFNPQEKNSQSSAVHPYFSINVEPFGENPYISSCSILSCIVIIKKINLKNN